MQAEIVEEQKATQLTLEDLEAQISQVKKQTQNMKANYNGKIDEARQKQDKIRFERSQLNS